MYEYMYEYMYECTYEYMYEYMYEYDYVDLLPMWRAKELTWKSNTNGSESLSAATGSKDV